MSKSPSIRRIKADIRELSIDPSDQYTASPLEHDMFEWHFTIRGAEGTDFEGGVYHGRILLPPEYPFKPPNIVFLTPSGRFECGVKVCLSFSAHHPELWQPAWGIRLILEALISFLPTPADGALGALDWTSEERKKLAKESIKFRCPICCAEGETCVDLLPEVKKVKGDDGDKKKTKFQEEIEKLKMLQFQNHAVEEEESSHKKDGDGNDEKKDDSTKEGVEEQGKNAQPDETTVNIKPSPTSPLQQPEKNESSTNLKPVEEKDTNEGSSEIPQTKVSSTAGERDSKNTTAAQPNATPNPSSQANNNTAPAPQRVRPPAVAPAAVNNNNNFAIAADAPIISDSLLNGMIGFFAVIVIVLLRQSQALVDELQRLGRDD